MNLVEPILFGVVITLLGLLLTMIFSFLKPELPKECEQWDKNNVMEATLFSVGFVFYFILSNDMVKSYYPSLFV
jgi:lipid-A-disaccharide synthase-like uncharacterized protein